MIGKICLLWNGSSNGCSLSLMRFTKRKVQYIKVWGSTRIIGYWSIYSLRKNNHFSPRLEMQLKFLLGVWPLFVLFPFSECRNMLNCNQNFWFKHLRNLSPGVSRLLKKCDFELLKDSELVFTFIRNKTDELQKYNRIWRTVLNTLNIFLENLEKESAIFSLRVAYKTRHLEVSQSGLKETVIAGMLGAAEHVNMIWFHHSWAQALRNVIGKKSRRLWHRYLQYTLSWLLLSTDATKSLAVATQI